MQIEQRIREAVALFNAGQIDQGIHLFRAVSVVVPAEPSALHAFALFDLWRQRLSSAERRLERVVAVAPSDVRPRILLARILADAGRLAEASRQFKRLLAIEPGNADTQTQFGAVLAQLNRDGEAALAYRTAIALAPDHLPAYAQLSSLLVAMGQADQADQMAGHGLCLAPEHMALWHVRMAAQRVKSGDPRIETVLGLADKLPELDEPNRLQLHFALGKLFDDTDERDRAFTHFLAGNRLKDLIFPYDERAALALLERIAATFTRPSMANLVGSGDPSTLPVFVIGMPRSGTTLISQILASHPRIATAGELPAFGAALNRLSAKMALPQFPDLIATMTPTLLRKLGAYYLEEARAASSSKPFDRVVDMMPANFMMIGLLHLAFPQARFIHATRDPMDTCLSIFFQNFAPSPRYNHDLATLGRFWRAHAKLMAHWRAVLPENVITDVRYEDVVGDLEGQARRLISHCGVEWDDACLSFHTGERLVRTASAHQVRQPLYSTSVGRWRRYATHLAPLLEALGHSSV